LVDGTGGEGEGARLEGDSDDMKFGEEGSALKLSWVTSILSRVMSMSARFTSVLSRVLVMLSTLMSASSRLTSRVSQVVVDSCGVGVALEDTCGTGAESVRRSVDMSPGVIPGTGDCEGVDVGSGGVVPGAGDCEGVDFGGEGDQDKPQMDPLRRRSSA